MLSVSRGLLLILAAEIILYATLLERFAPARGWSSALGLVLSIAISIRAVPLLVCYAIAWAGHSPVPRDQRVSLPRLAACVLLELGMAVLLFSVLMPFERKARLSPGMRGRTDAPILLVHGYLMTANSLWGLRRWLQREHHSVYSVNFAAFAGIDRYAAVIASEIDRIKLETGASSVVLIGHSMGGLAIRAYVRAHGGHSVARVITLGSPHHGSLQAWLSFGTNGWQMRPGSPWLRALEADEAQAARVPFLSIYSCHDEFVAPQDSSRLAYARNVPLAGLGHLTMPFSSKVHALVAETLAGDRKPQN